MVIDKGVGPSATDDYLELVGGTVDLLKLAFGTTAFYSESILRRKIEVCSRHGVACYPGGTFLKVAARGPPPLALGQDTFWLPDANGLLAARTPTRQGVPT